MRYWIMMSIILLMLTACEKKSDDATVVTLDEVEKEEELVLDKEDDHEFSRGQMVDHVYINDFFDIRYELPSDWLLLTLDEVDAIMNLGEKVLDTDNSDIIDDFETSDVFSLMGMVKYSEREKVSVNPSVIISAEKMEPLSEVKDGQTYLENTKETLMSIGVPYKFETDVMTMNIDGQDYGILDVTIDTGDYVIGQSYYAFYSNGYIVSIIMTYTEEDGMVELASVLAR